MRHRGTAIEPYIKYLIEAADELPARVRKHIKQFMVEVQELQLDPALDHAAKNFGLLYAAGCLGIDAKIVPWNKRETLTAVLTCFKEAIRVIRTHENALDEAKQELKRQLADKKIRSVSGSEKFGPDDAPGYRRVEGGDVVCTINSATFRSWFGNKILCAAVLGWLHAEGLLLLKHERGKVSEKTTEWAERSPRWPNGQTQKSFIFRDPFPSRRASRNA